MYVMNYSAKEGMKGKDLFQTPNHATRLIIPHIPQNTCMIWDCAAAEHKILDIMPMHYQTFGSDIRLPERNVICNFLTDPIPDDLILDWNCTVIITNPPFSLKKQFFSRCIDLRIPFALLIPFVMSKWTWGAFKKYNCQALIPDHRINYITPTGRSGKDSSAKFHSFWLCKDFNIPNQFEFVELTKEMMEDI